MQYMAMIYTPKSSGPDTEVIQAYGAFTKEMIAKGFFKQGDALQGAHTATCVSLREGKTKIKDGPFVEANEPKTFVKGHQRTFFPCLSI